MSLAAPPFDHPRQPPFVTRFDVCSISCLFIICFVAVRLSLPSGDQFFAPPRYLHHLLVFTRGYGSQWPHTRYLESNLEACWHDKRPLPGFLLWGREVWPVSHFPRHACKPCIRPSTAICLSQTFQQKAYHGSLEGLGLTEKGCWASCSTSLTTARRRVAGACASTPNLYDGYPVLRLVVIGLRSLLCLPAELRQRKVRQIGPDGPRASSIHGEHNRPPSLTASRRRRRSSRGWRQTATSSTRSRAGISARPLPPNMASRWGMWSSVIRGLGRTNVRGRGWILMFV